MLLLRLLLRERSRAEEHFKSVRRCMLLVYHQVPGGCTGTCSVVAGPLSHCCCVLAVEQLRIHLAGSFESGTIGSSWIDADNSASVKDLVHPPSRTTRACIAALWAGSRKIDAFERPLEPPQLFECRLPC